MRAVKRWRIFWRLVLAAEGVSWPIVTLIYCGAPISLAGTNKWVHTSLCMDRQTSFHHGFCVGLMAMSGATPSSCHTRADLNTTPDVSQHDEVHRYCIKLWKQVQNTTPRQSVFKYTTQYFFILFCYIRFFILLHHKTIPVSPLSYLRHKDAHLNGVSFISPQIWLSILFYYTTGLQKSISI